jgi:DNA adenine methylase
MESPEFTRVEPVRPVAPYIGGKRNLARQLVERIDQVPHATYAEPFVGMGGVFLRRRRRPKCEVINDLSGDVWTFYRVLQEHYAYFREELRFRLTSRAEFERLVAVDPSTLTDLQRAARFLYLQRTAFGGKVDGRNFGVSPGRGGSFDLNRLGPMLQDLHERLAGVVVERLPWAAFLARYDRPDTLFYLDPPYFGCEGDYGPGLFDRSQFALMAEALERLQGRFILSINDTPEIRAVFGRFRVEPVTLTYRVSGAPTEGRELIVSDW